MDNIIFSTEKRVFVFEGVETMRTGGQNLFRLVTVERFHIFGDHHLGQVFVAGAPGNIAIAAFFFPQNGKIDTGFLEHAGHGLGNLFAAIVKGARTADKI